MSRAACHFEPRWCCGRAQNALGTWMDDCTKLCVFGRKFLCEQSIISINMCWPAAVFIRCHHWGEEFSGICCLIVSREAHHRCIHGPLALQISFLPHSSQCSPIKQIDQARSWVGGWSLVLWGMAGGPGGVKPGEKGAERRPYCSLQLPERRLYPGGGWSLFPASKWLDKRKRPQVAPGEVWVGY